MQNEKGKLYYGIGLDNNQLRADAEKSRNIIKSIGDTSVSEGARIDSTFRKIGGTIAAAFTIQKAVQFSKAIVQVRGEIQQLEIAFETMLGSKAKADKMMSDVIAFAQKTPFTLTEVASNARQLMAMGIAAEDVMDTLKSLGDVAAGVSVPIARIAVNYGQVSALGRLQSREIRDFAMAGIPIVDELANMLGKTAAEVNEMVEAGKVGFPMVQQAFKNMSSEGGKFYNLMEKQNASVTGQISKLQDQIQIMFNKIGEANEGIIYKVIGGASELVENYEKIGKILAGLIATYGTYKAVLIATAAIQKSSLILKEVQAFLQLTRAIKSAKDAQLLLNMAMKSNPLIMLASIVAGVATAIFAFRKRTDEASDSVLGLARAQKTAGEEFDKEAAKVKALQDVMNNGKVAYDDRKKALNELKGIIPGYNAQLTEEGALINNNTEAIKAYLVQLERQIKMKAAQDELEEAYRQKRQLEKRVRRKV